MANREIENYRSSVQQIQSNPNQVAQTFATIGQKLIAEGQEAKITENFSKAQLDLQRVNQEYQIANEKNPFGGMEDLKVKRDEIFAKYGEEISPFFRKGWQDSTRSLAVKDDATTEAWAYSQTKKNTVVSINESIKNNMSQAALDGQNFGNSDQDEVGSLLNYSESKKQLMGFGDKHLGALSTTALLEDYDGDYLKSFISGVSETNPLKALRMMEDKKVKDSFKDQNQYLKMKDAVEARAMNIQKINSERDVLGVLRDENNLLTRSLETNVSYSDLQSEFSRLETAGTPMSSAAKSFFLKANGYASREGKLTPEEQMKNKVDIFNDMGVVLTQDSISSKDVAALQKRIYEGMNNGSLNDKEATQYLSQLLTPVVDQREEQLGKFSDNSWIAPDVGFGGLEKIFQDQIAVKDASDDRYAVTKALGLNEPEPGKLTAIENNRRKVKLYDYYLQALEEKAGTVGVPLAGIKNLNKTQQRQLYTDAQAKAVELFSVDENPALATLNDLPNQTLSKDKLIQGAAGNRDLKPDFTVNGKFKTIMKNGHMARKYEDGTIEVIY